MQPKMRNLTLVIFHFNAFAIVRQVHQNVRSFGRVYIFSTPVRSRQMNSVR